MEKITFTIDGEEKTEDFYVLEQTRLGGCSYLLVTDQKEGDADCWVLKDLSRDGDSDALYEMLEEGDELDAVFGIFARMMDDVDLQP